MTYAWIALTCSASVATGVLCLVMGGSLDRASSSTAANVAMLLILSLLMTGFSIGLVVGGDA